MRAPRKTHYGGPVNSRLADGSTLQILESEFPICGLFMKLRDAEVTYEKELVTHDKKQVTCRRCLHLIGREVEG
jgi:hypothetical protein